MPKLAIFKLLELPWDSPTFPVHSHYACPLYPNFKDRSLESCMDKPCTELCWLPFIQKRRKNLVDGTEYKTLSLLLRFPKFCGSHIWKASLTKLFFPGFTQSWKIMRKYLVAWAMTMWSHRWSFMENLELSGYNGWFVSYLCWLCCIVLYELKKIMVFGVKLQLSKTLGRLS